MKATMTENARGDMHESQGARRDGERLNGLDLGALRGLCETVAANPSEGRAGFRVCTRWAGGTRSVARVDNWQLGGRDKPRHFSIAADEPPELLGDSSAPNPQELLMAALNACVLVGYVAGCSVHGIELESIEIETAGELDLRGFLDLDKSVKPGYDEVEYIVRIKGNGTPEQFRQVHATVMATSPNFFNITHPVRVRPRLVIE
jgi:uncharacterized OsmC-like protein